MLSIDLTERDESIVGTLSLKVHVVTQQQAARAWWSGTANAVGNCNARMKKLEQAGLITKCRVNARPLLPLEKPLFSWAPGDATPAFGKVSYKLVSRWKQPLELVTVYRATKVSANAFGGFGGKFKHRTQITHDIHVAELFLRMLEADTTVAERFRGEEELQILGDVNPGEKVPDAIVFDEFGLPELVVEFGGNYGRSRVEKFHHYCYKRRLTYDLW